MSILLALALLALSLIAMGYSRRQPQIEAGGGFGWDGREYADAYEDAVGGSPHGAEQVVSFPFCKRVGLPAIAATIHSGDGFKGINAVAGLIAALGVFAVGLRRGGTLRAIVVTIPMAFYLFAPIRFSNFYPWTVDPPMMALMALAVLAFDFRRHTIGFLLLVAAIPIKETALYFAAAALVSLMIFDDKPEHRANPAGILTGEITAMCSGVAASDRQAESGAAGISRPTMIKPYQALEDPLSLRRWHTRP